MLPVASRQVLAELGPWVHARALAEQASQNGFTRLHLRYACGGEQVKLWVSIDNDLARAARDAGSIELLVDPDRTTSWIVAPS